MLGFELFLEHPAIILGIILLGFPLIYWIGRKPHTPEPALVIMANSSHTPTPETPPKVHPPVVAYKRAYMWSAGEDGEVAFSGVTAYASPYNIVGEAQNQVGFHMYKKLRQALNHPQEGNVFLEVVGSGHVEEHEVGYETTKQRVTQVLVGACNFCEKRPGVMFFLSEGDNPGMWLCTTHSRVVRALKSTLTVANNVRYFRYRKYQRHEYDFATVEALLQENFGHRVVVRSVFHMDPNVPLSQRVKYAPEKLPQFVPLSGMLPKEPEDDLPGSLIIE